MKTARCIGSAPPARMGFLPWLLAGAALIAPAPSAAAGECIQWDVGGKWDALQSDGNAARLDLRQAGISIQGASTQSADRLFSGPIAGTMMGEVFEATVLWGRIGAGGNVGIYSARMSPEGILIGRTHDRDDPGSAADWRSSRAFACLYRARSAPAPGAVALGRVTQAPAGQKLPVCDAAWFARADHSPAAPALQRQCMLAGCPRWNLGETMAVRQSGDGHASFQFKRDGATLRGTASTFYRDDDRNLHRSVGPMSGTFQASAFQATVYWDNGDVGVYEGQVSPEGLLSGRAHDRAHPGVGAEWSSAQPVGCPAWSEKPDLPAPAPKPVILADSTELAGNRADRLADIPPTVKLGRVAVDPDSAAAQRTICQSARAAQARQSPAAPGLARQCLASGGSLVAPTAVAPEALEDFANAGLQRLAEDELAAILRARQSEGAGQRGFDIGLGAAGDDTAPGPGKQRVRESLDPATRAGFDAALAYALDRNRNRDLADRGLAIDAVDPEVLAERGASQDVYYWLGFDIATGLFGDPALGAIGRTATGPGSQATRDALGAGAQRGFDASVRFHLARHYGP